MTHDCNHLLRILKVDDKARKLLVYVTGASSSKIHCALFDKVRLVGEATLATELYLPLAISIALRWSK